MHNHINVHNQPTAEINAITHTPPHHADEVFATAMLAMVSNVELLRTRNPKLIGIILMLSSTTSAASTTPSQSGLTITRGTSLRLDRMVRRTLRPD